MLSLYLRGELSSDMRSGVFSISQKLDSLEQMMQEVES